jgi:pimeloyl-ACP methyl ester carboxylesterase
MPHFDSFDGLSLYFDDEGDGEPVVLLHGFAADTNINYVRSGLLDALLDAGYRVIPLDARGHGLSSKPTDPAAYENDAMRQDVSALLDHLGVEHTAVVGYSMGAHTALRLAPLEPRVTALALLGIGHGGDGSDDDPDTRKELLAALEAQDPNDVEDPALRPYRIMAGLDGAPLRALLHSLPPPTHDRLNELGVPVILIVGEDDERAGDAGALAEAMDAKFVRVPGDHYTANARPELHQALLEFLAAH